MFSAAHTIKDSTILCFHIDVINDTSHDNSFTLIYHIISLQLSLRQDRERKYFPFMTQEKVFVPQRKGEDLKAKNNFIELEREKRQKGNEKECV